MAFKNKYLAVLLFMDLSMGNLLYSAQSGPPYRIPEGVFIRIMEIVDQNRRQELKTKLANVKDVARHGHESDRRFEELRLALWDSIQTDPKMLTPGEKVRKNKELIDLEYQLVQKEEQLKKLLASQDAAT